MCFDVRFNLYVQVTVFLLSWPLAYEQVSVAAGEEQTTVIASPEVMSRIMSRHLRQHGKAVVQKLRDLNSGGHQLTIQDLDEVLQNPTGPLGQIEYISIINLFFSIASEPDVNAKSLSTLYRSKREAISTFTCDYKIVSSGIYVDRGMDPYEHVRFRINKSDVMFDLTAGESARRLTMKRSISLMGDLRQLYQWSSQGLNDGAITTLKGRGECYHPDNLLSRCMLLNSPIDLGRKDSASDLAAAKHVVFPGVVAWEGHEVIVLGSSEMKFFLSPDLNYALVGIESRLQFDKEQGKLVEKKEATSCAFSGFKEFENGLWLPSSLDVKFYKDGKLAGTQKVTYQKIAVNSEIPSKDFDIIPDGVHVINQVENIAFVKGTGKVINLGLPHTVILDRKSSEWSLLKVLMLGLNIACVFVILGLIILRRRKSNQAK